MSNKKILTVVTNAATLTLTDGTQHPSGFWAEELAVPYKLYRQAGYAVDIATLGGIVPSVDKSSLNPEMMRWVRPPQSEADDVALSKELKTTLDGIAGLKAPKDVGALTKDELAAYAGVYISGGHGCMEDMPASPAMTRFLLSLLALDKPIGSVCHGPTAFLSPRDASGQSPFQGYHMTCFSHVEEFATPINGRLPLVLELELKRLGIHYSKGPYPWASHVVRDRNLVTGQNPYSSAAVGQAFLDLLAR
jgi:putative intracellular protease/amidase